MSTERVPGKPAGTLKFVVRPDWVKTTFVGVQAELVEVRAAAPAALGVTMSVMPTPCTWDPIAIFTKPVYTPAVSPVRLVETLIVPELAVEAEPLAGEAVSQVPPSVVVADAVKVTADELLTP